MFICGLCFADLPVKVFVVTDIHSTLYDSNSYDRKDGTAGGFNDANRFYSESYADMNEAVVAANANDVDFVIQLGDFMDGRQTDDCGDYNYPGNYFTALDTNETCAEREQQYLKNIEAVWATADANRYNVLGNWDPRLKIDCCEPYDTNSYFDIVDNTGSLTVGDSNYGERYYSFDVKGVHFIVLDTTGKSAAAGDYRSEYYTMSGVHYCPNDQVTWLAADLAANSTVPIFVFSHVLLSNPKMAPMVVNNKLDVRAKLHAVDNVVAVFSGHRHDGDKTETITESGQTITYHNIRGSIHGSSSNSYSIITIKPLPAKGVWAEYKIDTYGDETNAKSYNRYGVFK